MCEVEGRVHYTANHFKAQQDKNPRKYNLHSLQNRLNKNLH